MSADKPLTSFRPIAAPLDVDDAALEKFNDKLGVPTLVRPAADAGPTRDEKAEPPAPEPAAVMPASLEKLTIEVPEYLAGAVRRAALDGKSSARHVIMLALQKAGFEIAAADLVPDGRRARKQSQ